MRLLIGLVVAITMASPALADWQTTTWSMNRAAVIAATGAKRVEGTTGQRVWGADLGAEGAYSALGFDFTSQFFFDATDRLRVVKLQITDESRCEALGDTLDGIYGPSSGRDRSFRRWIDVASGDMVSFTWVALDASADCFVAYRPATPTGAQGL